MAKRIALFAFCCLPLVTGLSCHARREREPAPPAPSQADPAPPEEAVRVVPAPTLAAQADPAARRSHHQLLGKIEEAKAMLHVTPLLTGKIGGDNAILALWNPTACGPIRLVTMTDGTCRSRDCDITIVRPNGVNSQYQVNLPADHVVIALKTNVNHPRRHGFPVPAVYVPFSPALRNAESVRSGREYLLDLVKRGTERLNANDVPSQLDPAKRPTDTVPWKILATLLVVEHVNPDDFDSGGIGPEGGKVLTVLATNREDAYRYAVSYAKARGLAQFIQSTYDITRKRYPRARLPEDFVQGMTDHESAVCAQFCLADWSLTRLPERHLRRLQQNEEDLGAFLAAAYNGGEEKAARALTDDPANWEKDGHGLFPQTVKYVEIYRATYRYLFP